MTTPTYTPRADSLAAQVINFFRHNADEELMLDDIQEKFACTRGNIHTRLNPSVVIDNSSTLHSLREAMLAEWLALETQTDVEAVRIINPALVGDSHQAQTFGILA